MSDHDEEIENEEESQMSCEDAIDGVDEALRHAGDACRALAPMIELHLYDQTFVEEVSDCDRMQRLKAYASFARSTAEDRDFAGSQCARAVLMILLRCTTQEALDFITALEAQGI